MHKPFSESIMTQTMADLKPVTGRWYTASFHAPSRQIRITARGSRFSMFVPIVSACDQPGQRDVHQELSNFRLRKKGAATILTFTEKSALWDRKEYTIEFGPERIRYFYRVHGKGAVSRAYFFRSWFKDPSTVEEELGVVPGFDTVFSPAVNFFGKEYYFPGDTALMTVGDSPQLWGQGLASSPFCFAFNDRGDRLWAWAGLGVRAGQYTFEEFTWNENATKRIFGAGGMDCNYNGKLAVDGMWESPHLILGASDDPYQAIEAHTVVLEKEYGLKLPRKRKNPDWWSSPIFCGWGEQMSLGFRDYGNVEGVDVAKYCTQAMHDEWLEILRRHRIRPGQIIIDAGWQKPGTGGDMQVDESRWPDLRGWIEARRGEGIRTLLWMMDWLREGVPDEECITDAQGKAIAVDPTNPAYEKRLRAMVRRLVSDEPGCFNADGVKIDGEMGCPTGPGLTNHENLWGMELQRRWMKIVHDEAKRWKPDALIGAFMANPYMGDLTSVARAADLFSIKASPEDTMRHRARILRITNPASPIDCDHTYWYDQRDNWIDIMPAMLDIGVPCMYHAKYVWHKRPFAWPYIEEMTDEHYAVIRRVFDTYWKRLARKTKPRR